MLFVLWVGSVPAVVVLHAFGLAVVVLWVLVRCLVARPRERVPT